MCVCRGTVIFGFEQANRYTVYDQDGQVVAHLMEVGAPKLRQAMSVAYFPMLCHM